MSHFTTLVLVRDYCYDGLDDLKNTVNNMLAPFDENLEVPEYGADCHCIGQVAKRAAIKVAESKVGTLGSLRESFHKDRPKEEQTDAAWKEHIKAYVEAEKEAFENHPMKDKPDPTCGFYTEDYLHSGHNAGERFEDGSGCGGTGKYLSTYNPKSKWDWWQIGGRWQGALDPDYEYIKDNRNYEICSYCNGTGDRPDLSPPEWKEECHGCNVCFGTGKALKFTLAPHMKGNVKPVSEVLDYCPFAIVTPDGVWHERGEMGWWGIVTGEEENWPVIAKSILQENQKGRDPSTQIEVQILAVLCDLHI